MITAAALNKKNIVRSYIHLAYIIVTSASGVLSGRPLRNARDITILVAFASLIVPWKMPKSSMHLIETALPTQFSLIFVN